MAEIIPSRTDWKETLKTFKVGDTLNLKRTDYADATVRSGVSTHKPDNFEMSVSIDTKAGTITITRIQ